MGVGAKVGFSEGRSVGDMDTVGPLVGETDGLSVGELVGVELGSVSARMQ